MGRRWAAIGLAVVVTVAGCASSEMSLAEYAERVTAVIDRATRQYESFAASPQGGVLFAEPEQLAAYTPRDLQIAFEGMREIEDEVAKELDTIEPPEALADLHDLFFYSAYIAEEEALAARAGTATDWDELSESPEMAAYRAVLASDIAACDELQAEVDAIGQQGLLASTPWLAGEMTGTVDVVLGCDVYPENPEDAYRPPAIAVP